MKLPLPCRYYFHDCLTVGSSVFFFLFFFFWGGGGGGGGGGVVGKITHILLVGSS